MRTNSHSLFAYARQEGLREGWRVARLTLLKPLVYPVYRFVDRNYHTEARRRLAKVAGTAMWWELRGDDIEFRPGEPRTADEVIRELGDYADWQKPL